jgi:hypothetical protein
MSNYSISFSQRTTVATSFGPEAGGDRYYLKAVSENRKSRQHIGYATVVSRTQIFVTTVNGTPVGVAKSRKEAKAMIDAYHRENNLDEYWMWAKDTLTGAE